MTNIYKIGDKVKLIEPDEYLGGPVQEKFWSEHGKGPFVVEEVESVAKIWGEHAIASVKHPQLVTLADGERLSGYWLEPVGACPTCGGYCGQCGTQPHNEGLVQP